MSEIKGKYRGIHKTSLSLCRVEILLKYDWFTRATMALHALIVWWYVEHLTYVDCLWRGCDTECSFSLMTAVLLCESCFGVAVSSVWDPTQHCGTSGLCNMTDSTFANYIRLCRDKGTKQPLSTASTGTANTNVQCPQVIKTPKWKPCLM